MEDKLVLKQKLLAEAIRLQKDMVANAKKAMQEAQESAIDSGDQSEDTLMDSYREEMQNQRDLFARQLDQTLDDLNILNQVAADKIVDNAQFGALVETDVQKLFICISLGNVSAEGKTYFAVSPSAPLVKAMAGKKKGESFSFRDKQFTIKEVF